MRDGGRASVARVRETRDSASSVTEGGQHSRSASRSSEASSKSTSNGGLSGTAGVVYEVVAALAHHGAPTRLHRARHSFRNAVAPTLRNNVDRGLGYGDSHGCTVKENRRVPASNGARRDARGRPSDARNGSHIDHDGRPGFVGSESCSVEEGSSSDDSACAGGQKRVQHGRKSTAEECFVARNQDGERLVKRSSTFSVQKGGSIGAFERGTAAPHQEQPFTRSWQRTLRARGVKGWRGHDSREPVMLSELASLNRLCVDKTSPTILSPLLTANRSKAPPVVAPLSEKMIIARTRLPPLKIPGRDLLPTTRRSALAREGPFDRVMVGGTLRGVAHSRRY